MLRTGPLTTIRVSSALATSTDIASRQAALVVTFFVTLFVTMTGCSGEDDSFGHLHQCHGCAAGGAGAEGGPRERASDYSWTLPPGFPAPWEPADNPTTEAKVELGRHLFYDRRLSADGSVSCSSCHIQERAFTDGRRLSVGATGQMAPRNAQSLANVGYASTLTWANPLLVEMERQAQIPLFGDDPVEHGLRDADELRHTVQNIEAYGELFAAAFPEVEEIGTVLQVTQALAAFQRTLISGNSPFDRFFELGEQDAISDSAKRGHVLFNSERLECFHCHAGFNFSDHVHWAGKAFFDAPFHNTGLYDIDGEGGYPDPNLGLYEVTLRPADMGRFKAPTLRNVEVTGPYMHDGSIETLEEVLDHYAAGGRTIESGPNAGVGADNPYKSDLLLGFELSESEKADVIAFLKSLTDQSFLQNPEFSNPW